MCHRGTMTYMKYLIGSILLFVVLFFDQTFIGPVKVSHLWKALLFGYITIIVFLNTKNGLTNSFLLLGIATAFSLLVSTTTPHGFHTDLLIFFDIYSLPLFYVYFRNKWELKDNYQGLDRTIIFFALFVIISNIPFLLGILESPKDIEELLSSEEDLFMGITGLFHNASGASKVFTVATLTIIAYSRKIVDKNKKYKLAWVVLIIIGMTSIVFSFTRTGWALFILGFSFLLLYKSRFRSKIRSIVVISLLLFAAVILFRSNEALYNRLIGRKANRAYVNDFNSISSGRGSLYKYSFEIIKEANTSEFLLGYGSKGALDEMKKKIGNRTYPHNRFLEIFLVGGLITFLLYLLYLIKLLRLIPSIKRLHVSTYEKLPLAIFFIYFISLFPSHGLGIYSNIIFAAIIAKAQLEGSTSELAPPFLIIDSEREEKNLSSICKQP